MPVSKFQFSTFTSILSIVSALLLFADRTLSHAVSADDDPPVKIVSDGNELSLEAEFDNQIAPFLKKYCLSCHNADNSESGIRVDLLSGDIEDRYLKLWNGIKKQVSEESMPPEDETQPTPKERKTLIDWIDRLLITARSRESELNGSVRRLTVSQYRNTLRDLLGLEDDFTDLLPPDAVSRDGFRNNAETMNLSPLLLEAYFEIAEQALDRCLVDEIKPPSIQNFKMELGKKLNAEPCPDKLILGANNHLLKNDDFVVTELTPAKPFDFDPFRMQTKFRFIEGYEGNSTVRGWREYDSIYHAVFACMRGSEGYPKGHAYQTIPSGLLLRPAIPSAELFQIESTYGPKANFKISLRELPDRGRFRVTVKAAKYPDGLLLDQEVESANSPTETSLTVNAFDTPQTIEIESAGVYRVDAFQNPDVERKNRPNLLLWLGDREFSGFLKQPAFLVVRLPKGKLALDAKFSDDSQIEKIVLTRLSKTDELSQRFEVFEKRSPRIGVHLGLRRDCGSTLTQVGQPQPVTAETLSDFVFEGAISNFPSPDVEKDNVNYLAGIREIGVRSEYTDGRDMPRLLIRSIEFEGPLYESWPPATHRNLIPDLRDNSDPAASARRLIRSFATRAFRRPTTAEEDDLLLSVWQNSFAENQDFQESIKATYLVVLTSPQFLFLIENSESPKPEPLTDGELASKLSYFLWNTAPDAELLQLASQGVLQEKLDEQIARMIGDPRFVQFLGEFASQWLSLEKFDIVEIDREKYPLLTRDTRTQLREEPIQFLNHLFQQNLPVRNLIESDFVLANEVVASYYGLSKQSESGFTFLPIKSARKDVGGILTQAAILSGLSDGREANPVKRGAWLARKMINEPPDDPPPNVPALPKDNTSELTLREKLERHRNQKGCVKCHEGIDPWGIPFQQYDAGGLFRTLTQVDARSTLPDGTKVTSVSDLQAYLTHDRSDDVAFSFLKHLAIYGSGRDLTYNEIEDLRENGLQLKPQGYPVRDLLRLLIHSQLFLTK